MWAPCPPTATSAPGNAPVWRMLRAGGATNVVQDTGILLRVWAAETVAATRTDPEATNAIHGRASATARSELEVSTATSAPRASSGSVLRAVNDVPPARQKVRCVTRTMAVVSARSLRGDWAAASASRGLGAGRRDWGAGSASATMLDPLDSTAAPEMGSASAGKAMLAGIATRVPWATSVIRSAGAAAVIRMVPSPSRMVRLPVIRMASAPASHW